MRVLPDARHLPLVEDRGNSFAVVCSNTKKERKFVNSGRWETAEFPVHRAAFTRNSKGAHITIAGGKRPIHFHMVEIVRDR